MRLGLLTIGCLSLSLAGVGAQAPTVKDVLYSAADSSGRCGPRLRWTGSPA